MKSDFIKELEKAMWEAAKGRNRADFLNLVDENAVMVCGGYRCSGREYAGIIEDFDLADYEISDFEIVAETETIVQIHYSIETKVSDKKNGDLAGKFNVTSTWKNSGGKWKLVFNMDSRIF
ncbi:nuclear transport factor 2 family protein [uncultured Treponema sp.]|uniref:nuclear transport factor 2 family protein n=1 Tax=uncultured Treponema sp. TaxID=162155 RepID=UPI0026327EA7|nr:nuclear transport factor 2 family protein [uncultured Treponema sp.]